MTRFNFQTQRILIRALFDKNFPAGSLDVLAVFAGLSKADSVFTVSNHFFVLSD